MEAAGAHGKVTVEIEKRLPVQGGLGAASSNAVATMVGLEAALKKKRALKKALSEAERLRIAAAVGSDLPLFLVGGTVLGVGRGEEVYPLRDLRRQRWWWLRRGGGIYASGICGLGCVGGSGAGFGPPYGAEPRQHTGHPTGCGDTRRPALDEYCAIDALRVVR